MTEIEISHDQAEYLFLRRESAAMNSVWWLLGGLGLLGLATVGFVVALVTRIDQLSMHAMTTLPMLGGLALIATAWSLARTPRQVAVGPDGLCIEGRRGSRRYAWSEIGWTNVTTGALHYRRQLLVYDTGGKTIAKLSEAFDEFDTMVELVAQRIADKKDDTSEQIRARKSKRSAVFCGAVGILMLVVAGFVAWMTYREQRAARLLEEVGIPGVAEIERRFLAPNGITPRLEYRVRTPDGRSATRNAEVVRSYWDSLEGATTVPVTYVPNEPEISKLQIGEPEERDPTKKPLIGYGLSALVSVICLVVLAAAILQWYGWDIDLDSKTGKVSIKRFGTGR
jgi:hypothetical protein